MTELIGVDIEGLEELVPKLDKMPQEVRDAAAEEAAKYIFNVVQAYPPQRRVTRKSVYGTSFKSEKQRRWFFAALRSGAINVPYRRTQAFRRAWRILGGGIKTLILNPSPYGPYLMEKGRQNLLLAKIGWETLDQIMHDRQDAIRRKLEAGMKKGMRKAGFR